MPDAPHALYFQLFNEIGILEQLSRTLLEAQLPDGMLISHFSVLNHLIRVKDGQTPQGLASAFQVPKTTMTHTLKGLDAAGLIVLHPNPKDGRSKTVWITEAGRSFRNDAIARLGPEFDKIRHSFPEIKAQDLVPLLSELRQIMDRARD